MQMHLRPSNHSTPPCLNLSIPWLEPLYQLGLLSLKNFWYATFNLLSWPHIILKQLCIPFKTSEECQFSILWTFQSSLYINTCDSFRNVFRKIFLFFERYIDIVCEILQTAEKRIIYKTAQSIICQPQKFLWFSTFPNISFVVLQNNIVHLV